MLSQHRKDLTALFEENPDIFKDNQNSWGLEGLDGDGIRPEAIDYMKLLGINSGKSDQEVYEEYLKMKQKEDEEAKRMKDVVDGAKKLSPYGFAIGGGY